MASTPPSAIKINGEDNDKVFPIPPISMYKGGDPLTDLDERSEPDDPNVSDARHELSQEPSVDAEFYALLQEAIDIYIGEPADPSDNSYYDKKFSELNFNNHTELNKIITNYTEYLRKLYKDYRSQRRLIREWRVSEGY